MTVSLTIMLKISSNNLKTLQFFPHYIIQEYEETITSERMNSSLLIIYLHIFYALYYILLHYVCYCFCKFLLGLCFFLNLLKPFNLLVLVSFSV